MSSNVEIIAQGRPQQVTDEQLREIRGRELSWAAYCQARLNADHSQAISELTKSRRHFVRVVLRDAPPDFQAIYTKDFCAIASPRDEGDDASIMIVHREMRGADDPVVRLFHMGRSVEPSILAMLQDSSAVRTFFGSVVQAGIEAAVRECVDRFENHYEHCGQEWSDTHSCMCNDRCPCCNKEIEPHRSDVLAELDVSPQGLWELVDAGQEPAPVPGEQMDLRMRG